MAPVCGSPNWGIRWFIQSQCKPTGTWTFNLKNNGVIFKSAYVDILPKINEVAALQKYYEYQASYPNDNYDSICLPKTGTIPKRCGTSKATNTPYKISSKGCAISSLAMVKRYHHNNPSVTTALNENSFLVAREGFTGSGGVDWTAVSDGFMSFQYDGSIWPDPNITPPSTAMLDKRLRQSLCENGPTIVHVKNTQHFVVVTGFDQVNGWEILDPGHLNNHSMSMYGGYSGIRLVKGPKSKPLPATYTNDFIIIYAYSPVELLLIDPSGNKVGFDRTTGQKVNIPDSTYSLQGQYNIDPNYTDPDPAKELILHKPIPGAYRLEVLGTGTGTYDLEFRISDTNGTKLLLKTIYDTPVTPGAIHTYTFNYNSAPGSAVTVQGGPPPVGSNTPPMANAGLNQALECSAGFANATLNGAGSSDPNGDALTYNWSGTFGTATGLNPVVNLPFGTHNITLTVNDGKGGIASATTQVIVQDTTPPVVSAGPNVTIPATGANGASFNLQPTVSDACCITNVVVTPQLAVYPVGMTPITATATDCAGNISSSTMQLTVQAVTPPILNPGNGSGQPDTGNNPPPSVGNEGTESHDSEADDMEHEDGEQSEERESHQSDTGIERLE